MRIKIETQAGRLFDYLVGKPEGVTRSEMEAALGLKRVQTVSAIRELRLLLGNSDSINLVADPNGANQPWIYTLVGTVEGARPWQGNQIAHLESRIATSQAIAASLVTSVKGRRDVDARSVRLISRYLNRLAEDLADLRDVDHYVST